MRHRSLLALLCFFVAISQTVLVLPISSAQQPTPLPTGTPPPTEPLTIGQPLTMILGENNDTWVQFDVDTLQTVNIISRSQTDGQTVQVIGYREAGDNIFSVSAYDMENYDEQTLALMPADFNPATDVVLPAFTFFPGTYFFNMFGTPGTEFTLILQSAQAPGLPIQSVEVITKPWLGYARVRHNFDLQENEVVSINPLPDNRDMLAQLTLLDPDLITVANSLSPSRYYLDTSFYRANKVIERFVATRSGSYEIEATLAGSYHFDTNLTFVIVRYGIMEPLQVEPITISGTYESYDNPGLATLEAEAGDVFTILLTAHDTDFQPQLSLCVEPECYGTIADGVAWYNTPDLTSTMTRIERFVFFQGGTFTLRVANIAQKKGDYDLTIQKIGKITP